MTALKNRPHTALLVIDMQNKVLAAAHARAAVIGHVAEVVAKARQSQTPVIWVQHTSADLPQGSDAWQIVPELVPNKAELRVDKHYGDAFEDTSLEAALHELQVGKLVVVGAQTDACIRSSLHGAHVRGYDVVLVSDAHTTDDYSKWGAPPPEQVIAHTNLYWAYESAPGRTTGVVASKDLDFSA